MDTSLHVSHSESERYRSTPEQFELCNAPHVEYSDVVQETSYPSGAEQK